MMSYFDTEKLFYRIIGLYVSVVLVVGRLVRTVFIGTTASIMFT